MQPVQCRNIAGNSIRSSTFHSGLSASVSLKENNTGRCTIYLVSCLSYLHGLSLHGDGFSEACNAFTDSVLVLSEVLFVFACCCLCFLSVLLLSNGIMWFCTGPDQEVDAALVVVSSLGHSLNC